MNNKNVFNFPFQKNKTYNNSSLLCIKLILIKQIIK